MKNRIDKELVRRNLVPSRAKAQELIESKFVKCNGLLIIKNNYLVEENDLLEVLENDTLKFVSRAGLKLEKAIKEFNLNFEDLKVMDIGSSTGGFCDCALKYGAKSVVAVDVGTDLLHESLRNNPNIDLHEKTNFKDLDHKYFENIDVITCDVSFISLTKIIEKISSENILVDVVCLIKPQFECGREIATKYKGVIINKNVHIEIINKLIEKFNEFGFSVLNLTYSPIKGGDGNIEYVAYITNKKESTKKFNVEKLVKNAFKGQYN